MHIHDFHSKFVSSNEECHLFEALRSLSQVESAEAVFGDGEFRGDWVTWPPMDAHASNAASTGI
jgi:hypothetical protein